MGVIAILMLLGTQGVAPLALGYEQISLSGCIGARCEGGRQKSTDDKPRAIASLLGIAEVRRRKTKSKSPKM